MQESASGGVSARGGVCLVRGEGGVSGLGGEGGGVSGRGGWCVSSRGVVVCLVWGGVAGPGGLPQCLVNRMTNRCKKNTFQ